MEVTVLTWIVGVLGILLMGILAAAQFVAVIKPRDEWTIKNVYGGDPSSSDPKAYFAFNQGLAWADVFFWAPLQLAASIGMLMGRKWGFLLALIGAVPFCYTAITIFIWDRDMGIRQNTFYYWFIIWAIWPIFGLTQMIYCFIRLF